MAKSNTPGRLLRESNPQSGTIPGFTPQFFDKNGYATEVDPDNPYPSGDYGMTEGGVWVPKKVADDGTTLTQLTGSIVENIVYDKVDYEYVKDYRYGYLSIGKNGFFDQQGRINQIIDISKYRTLLFYFKNGSDAEISLSYGTGSGFNFSWLSVQDISKIEGSARKIGNHGKRIQIKETIPVDAEITLTSDDLPELKNTGYISFVVCMGNVSNATEGSYTCALSGVK